MSLKQKRGILVAFEGMDRTGKTTQAKLLFRYLRSNKIPVEYLKFPDRFTDSGKIIHNHLIGKTNVSPEKLHKLFSENRWEKFNLIMMKLASGTSVILDRYLYSGLVFASVSGLNLVEMKLLEKGLPEPDIVFFLFSAKPMTERRGFGKEVFETEKFQKQVNLEYQKLFSSRNNWVQIDCTQSINETRSRILEEYRNVFSRTNLSEHPITFFM